MRTTVEPPPTSRCDRCGGQLTLKRVEAAPTLRGSSTNVFSCSTCGNERSFVVYHDRSPSRLSGATRRLSA